MGFRRRLKNKLKQVLAPQDASPVPPASPPPDSDGFQAVCPSEAVDLKTASTVPFENTVVAVFRTEQGLYVIDNACTHEDGPLGEGTREGPIVTCPYHNWRFDLTTGECLSAPNRQVACFSVREQDGWIWIGSQTSAGCTTRGGEHDDGLAVHNIQKDEPCHND